MSSALDKDLRLMLPLNLAAAINSVIASLPHAVILISRIGMIGKCECVGVNADVSIIRVCRL